VIVVSESKRVDSPESPEMVTVTTDSAVVALSTGNVIVAGVALTVVVDNAVTFVTVTVTGAERLVGLRRTGAAVSEDEQDEELEPGWTDGRPREEELADRKPGRALAVAEKQAVLEVIVNVVALGIGEDLVQGAVASPEAALEQDELEMAVVACPREMLEEVDVGATAVASSAAVLEHVVSKTSSLAASQTRPRDRRMANDLQSRDSCGCDHACRARKGPKGRFETHLGAEQGQCSSRLWQIGRVVDSE
jgi:hypothetical protein